MRKPGDVLFQHLVWKDGKSRWHITKEKMWMGDTMLINLSCKECEEKKTMVGRYNSETKEVTVAKDGTKKRGKLRWKLTSQEGPCIEWEDGSKWVSSNWKTWRKTAVGVSVLVTLLVGGSLYMSRKGNEKIVYTEKDDTKEGTPQEGTSLSDTTEHNAARGLEGKSLSDKEIEDLVRVPVKSGTDYLPAWETPILEALSTGRTSVDNIKQVLQSTDDCRLGGRWLFSRLVEFSKRHPQFKLVDQVR